MTNLSAPSEIFLLEPFTEFILLSSDLDDTYQLLLVQWAYTGWAQNTLIISEKRTRNIFSVKKRSLSSYKNLHVSEVTLYGNIQSWYRWNSSLSLLNHLKTDSTRTDSFLFNISNLLRKHCERSMKAHYYLFLKTLSIGYFCLSLGLIWHS